MTVPQQQPSNTNTTLHAPDRLPADVIHFCEQAALRTPFEEARKYSRVNQRIMEKELPALVAALREKRATGDVGVEERFRERLAKVEARVKANREREVEYLRRLKVRQAYLERVLDPQQGARLESEWIELRLKRMVVEYKLDQGGIEEAQHLVHQLNLHDWIDIEPFQERVKILRDLQDRQFATALQWCSEYRQSLKRQKSLLEFMLRRQEMIEMALTRPDEAIAYGRKHLYPWLDGQGDTNDDQEQLWTLAESAMNQIIFQDAQVMQQSHTQTIELFMKEFNAMYSLSDPNLLYTTVRAGLCLLKTPSCGDPSSYNLNCPACQPELHQLAASLPHAHHDTSTLVCRVTCERMDEDNPPMALPNGHVYSERGLRKCVSASGAVRCLCTGAEFAWEEVRKVFIT